MRIELVIKGEAASKANSRMLVKFGDRPAIIKSPKARDYERDALLQIPTSKRAMLEGKLRITIHIYYRTERPDLDESVILDVLQSRYKNGALLREGVYKNDRQIREKHIFHGIDEDNPRAEIVVETLDVVTEKLFPIAAMPPEPTGADAIRYGPTGLMVERNMAGRPGRKG